MRPATLEDRPPAKDDLATLAGGSLAARKKDADLAARAAEVLRAAWDPVRFPWLTEGREPKPHERDAAIAWTAGIWAVEKVRTRRRIESSQRQEEGVAALLRESRFEDVAARSIASLDDLDRGTFAREANLAGSKCDVPVRLRDGRLLAVECKVSNSALNSVKRLIRETGGKARAWNVVFGQQVVTAAVLSGVYKLGNLMDAQRDYGVAIFWQHDLEPLRQFLAEAV